MSNRWESKLNLCERFFFFNHDMFIIPVLLSFITSLLAEK